MIQVQRWRGSQLESSIKIDGVRYVVTMDPERRIIADGSVMIRGSRIIRVGKAAELADETADRVIDGSGMVLTPGFVNGHMHISYAHAARGLFPDDLGSQYLPNVFALQAAMTAEDEYSTSLLAITELLKYGTTTFLDPGTTTHLEACLEAYRVAGCRIVVGRSVQDRSNPLNVPVFSVEAALNETESAINRYNHALDGMVTAWAMPLLTGVLFSGTAQEVLRDWPRKRKPASRCISRTAPAGLPNAGEVTVARPRNTWIVVGYWGRG